MRMLLSSHVLLPLTLLFKRDTSSLHSFHYITSERLFVHSSSLIPLSYWFDCKYTRGRRISLPSLDYGVSTRKRCHDNDKTKNHASIFGYSDDWNDGFQTLSDSKSNFNSVINGNYQSNYSRERRPRRQKHPLKLYIRKLEPDVDEDHLRNFLRETGCPEPNSVVIKSQEIIEEDGSKEHRTFG